MLSCFLSYSLFGELLELLIEVRTLPLPKRQVTLISQLYFLYALVFSISMHDRIFVFQVYAMLRTPSSV